MSLKVGVVGLGAVAQAVHLPLLNRRPDLYTMTSFCDVSPDVLEALGSRYGISPQRRFSQMSDLLDAGGVDAVVLLARGSHAAAIEEVWRAGLPIFSEKPLAYTTAEVDALLEVRDPPPLMVGYMKQYDPAVVAAARALEQIDDVRSIEASVLHPPGASQLEMAHLVESRSSLPAAVEREQAAEEARLRAAAVGDADTDTWRAYRGALVSSLAHDLSIMRSFGSTIATVDHADMWRMSSAHQRRDPGRDRRSFGDRPPSIQATGSLTTGGRWTLGWHYLPDLPAYRETVRVLHGAGTLELTFPSPYLLNAPTELVITESDGTAERRAHRRSVVEAFDVQLEAFAALVTDGTPPATGLEGGRSDILDCQKIMAACASTAGTPIGGEVGAVRAGAAR